MTFADKLIEERKKLGLSQEELAEKLSVSRQAVSKWESAQAVPDLSRILALAALFSVTTDYLLKDDLGPESRPAAASAAEKENEDNAGRVSLFYWNIVLAGYLTWSFISRDWGFTWIVWAIAAVLFVPVKMIAAHFHGKKR